MKNLTTKKDLAELVRLWSDFSNDEIAEKLNRPISWISANVKRIRDAGGNKLLPSKKGRSRRYIDALIQEFIHEQ